MKSTAKTFKALADETRLRILSLLLKEGELCVSDFVDALELPQSTISRHLTYLKNAGWVEDRRKGVWVVYTLTDADNQFQNGLAYLLKRHLHAIPKFKEDLVKVDSTSNNSTSR
jgi:ArsR family transcriptional regulator